MQLALITQLKKATTVEIWSSAEWAADAGEQHVLKIKPACKFLNLLIVYRASKPPLGS